MRYNILLGNKVEFIPGWDCHGLPIELKAVKKRDGKSLEPRETRRVAYNFAEHAVEVQMANFQRWGILGDWENHWKTMSIYLAEKGGVNNRS